LNRNRKVTELLSDTPVTDQLVDWVYNLTYDDIPQDVFDKGKEHLLDGYGVGLAGVVTDGHQILREHLAEWESKGQAQVFGTNLRAPVELAALINGTSMHAMDYDDTQIPKTVAHNPGWLAHPTTPSLGAASVVAEQVGASGKDLLTAFIIGIEVQCLLSDAAIKRDGWHPTAIIGGFGAFAAVGKLLGLTKEQLQVGLGIVAPLSAGYSPNNGTMTKWLQAGQAAQAGVMAANLVRKGFTAAPNMLDDPRGFLKTVGEGIDRFRYDGKFGNPYFLVDPGISIKPYPSGSLGHPGQDAVIELVTEHDVKPEDVEEATAGTNSKIPNALRHPRPQNAAQARFSYAFNLAIGIVKRKAGLAEFTDEVVQSPEVQEMLTRCHNVVDPEIDERGRHMEVRIRLKLKDGRELEKMTATAIGHPTKPMSREQLAGKFLDCADLVISRDTAERVVESVWDLESVDNVADLHKHLVGSVNV
jgi:2-methylcitrate dehydratase PrpD